MSFPRAYHPQAVDMSQPQWKRRRGYQFYSDFMASSCHDLSSSTSGTGAAQAAGTATSTNRVGVIASGTGTTATGRAAMTTFGSALTLGDGVWTFEGEFQLSGVSDGTETYIARIGFLDDGTAAPVDYAMFYHDNASGNWLCKTGANSVETGTSTDSGVAVTANTWYKLKIVITDVSRVDYYINDALVASHTANIPNGSGRETGFGWSIIKSLGATQRALRADWLAVEYVATSLIRN